MYLDDIPIDSGQFVILNHKGFKSFSSGDDYIDKSIPVVDGKPIDKSYLDGWERVVDGYGKSLNALDAEGRVTIETKNLSNGLDYQGCCDTTFYSEKGCGFLSKNDGFASCTTYGDGQYPVFQMDDGFAVITSYTSNAHFDHETNELLIKVEREDQGVVSFNGLGVIGDPCSIHDQRSRIQIQIRGDFTVQRLMFEGEFIGIYLKLV